LQNKLSQVTNEKELLVSKDTKVNNFMHKNFNLLEQDQKRITSAANRIKMWIEHNYNNDINYDERLRREWKDKLELKEAFEKQLKLVDNDWNQEIKEELLREKEAIILETERLEKKINC